MKSGFNWEPEKEKLTKLILEDNISYEEIGRMYGCCGANIKKAAKKLGIELPIRNEKNSGKRGPKKKYYCIYCNKELDTKRKYCDIHCQTQYEYESYIERWKQGLETGYKEYYKIIGYVKRYLYEKHNYCCEKCGCNWKNPYTGLTILQIHHVDGDASNTKEDNLQVLCPNCHAMTENFGNRNKSCINSKYTRIPVYKRENNI